MNARAKLARFRRGNQIAHAHAVAALDHCNRGSARMLLERQRHFARRKIVLRKRTFIAKFPQAQLGDQPPHGNAAKFSHGMRLDRFGSAFPSESALARDGLALHANILRIQILRARKHSAQVAFAAVERGHRQVSRLRKAQRPHGRMRLNGMAEQIARAELRAEAALIASRAADLGDVHPRRIVAPDERMLGGQHDDAAGGLRDGHVQIGCRLGHHHAAEKHAEVGNRGSTGGIDNLANGDANGNAQRDGMGDSSGDGEVLVRHRTVQPDVHQRLHIGHGAVDVLRQATGRNHAASDHVHQDELVAGGIAIGQRLHTNARRRLRLNRGNDVEIFFLDADHALARPDQLHGHRHAAQERLGVVVQQFFVFMEERFALGGVGNQEGGLGFELDRRGKAAAAGADDSQLVDSVKRGCEAGATLPGNASLWRHHLDYPSKSAKITIDSDE